MCTWKLWLAFSPAVLLAGCASTVKSTDNLVAHAAPTSVNAAGPNAKPHPLTLDARPRVLVSTDIGGTDDDDFQSMVHFLVYADRFDVEGLVSSPFGAGRKKHILEAIDRYAQDYANLRTYSDAYPTPDALRAITKEGHLESPGPAGFGPATEGSAWIIERARQADPRPLWVLVWGGIEDLAQALHDAPDIEGKLRAYFIGGPNKKWSVDAYQYVATYHPRLWIIESNATYRGWFVGGPENGEWSNTGFVSAHVAGRGALGSYFASFLGGTMKMGDTPSVVYLLHDAPEDPSQPGWGGQFVRAWERPHKVFHGLTTPADQIEQFGVLELALPLPPGGAQPSPQASLAIENQSLVGFVDANGAMRFRASPKDAKTYSYTIASNVRTLDAKTGAFTSFRPPPAAPASPHFPNWWTDDPAPELADGPHLGVKTVSRWREEFLRDFASRMLRCQAPAPGERPGGDAPAPTQSPGGGGSGAR